MQRHFAFLSALTLVACVGEIGSTGDDGDDGSGSDEPVVCEQTRSYPGYGGTKLEEKRPQIEPGSDRMRLKPFTVLATEYNRALGLTGFDTTAYAATFGRPPARWYQEPAASANTIYAAFALAYDACTQRTAQDALYDSAVTPELAGIMCREHARRAWHREATDAEANACITYTVDQTDPADAPRKRWAYSCAAVLSASGFLAY